MNQFPKICTIRIEGNLHERWKDWFDGMTVKNLENGEVLLQGCIEDQSVLIGIINQIHNLNLILVSVNYERSNE
jgi:hypothetical protein